MLAVATNYWPDAKCAKAFWAQHDLPPYRQLLADTVEWADPSAGERWLDLGCGGGAITRAIWERTGGTVAEVVGADCAGKRRRLCPIARNSGPGTRRTDPVRLPRLQRWVGDICQRRV